MKTGSESKTKVYTALVLVVVAVMTVAWAWLSTGSSSRTPEQQVASRENRAKVVPVESLDPRLRLDLLASSEDVKYEGKGKNIFRASMDSGPIEKVKIPPLVRDQQAALQRQQMLTPQFPPITLKFFGISNAKGEKPRAFLSQGDDVWIAHEGDVVNRHYRVIRISPRDVEVEDLLNNHHENIPLTQG
jgi:hypothetical protein